jgi:hypothetical protein
VSESFFKNWDGRLQTAFTTNGIKITVAPAAAVATNPTHIYIEFTAALDTTI